MIEVDIHNCRSKVKVDIYRKAVECFVHALMPKIKNMYIDVCLENNLDADAFCTQIGSNQFLIEVSKKLPTRDQIKSIAHEMVHCKQFYQKKLQYKDNKIFWEGKTYKLNQMKRNNLTYDEYHSYLNTPWEIEAYEMEDVLFNNFVSNEGIIPR